MARLRRTECPGCGTVGEWAEVGRFSARCLNCNHVYSISRLKPKRSGRPKRSRGQEISRRQERRLAKERPGARTTIGSGCLPHDPSDVEEKEYRYECKATDARERILKLEELQKLEGEALERSQVPVFQLEFVEEGKGRQRYAVLRWSDFQALTGGV